MDYTRTEDGGPLDEFLLEAARIIRDGRRLQKRAEKLMPDEDFEHEYSEEEFAQAVLDHYGEDTPWDVGFALNDALAYAGEEEETKK